MIILTEKGAKKYMIIAIYSKHFWQNSMPCQYFKMSCSKIWIKIFKTFLSYQEQGKHVWHPFSLFS